MLHDRFVRVAGHEKNLGLGVSSDERCRQLRVAQAGHHDVGQEELDGTRVIRRECPAKSNDDHVLALTGVDLQLRGGVVDAETLEAREVRYVEPSIPNARRDQDRSRKDCAPGAHVDAERPTLAVEANRRARDRELRSELLGQASRPRCTAPARSARGAHRPPRSSAS